jgi:RNA polymerase sigma-70 factor (ECF subfamily)
MDQHTFDVDDSNIIDNACANPVFFENRQAVRNFWSTNYNSLVARARRSCLDRNQAEDLVSRATIRLLHFVETHDRPLEEVGALFFTVLRNLAIDEHRAARRAALLYDHSIDLHADADLWRLPICVGDAHEQLVDSQTLGAIQMLLDGASGETRALFVHRFVEDRSYDEIADSLCISAPSARKRVQKLRAWLDAVRDDAVTDQSSARLSSRTRVKQRTAAHGL